MQRTWCPSASAAVRRPSASFPLCRTHHRLFDCGRLALGLYLGPEFGAELAHALEHVSRAELDRALVRGWPAPWEDNRDEGDSTMSKANGNGRVTDLASATAVIEREFGADAVRSLGEAPLDGGRGDPDRGALARPGARHRRRAARPDGRGLRAGVLGQDDPRLPRDRRGAGGRRALRLHRRRARDGRRLRARRSGSRPTSCWSPSPTTARQALEIADLLVRSGELALVVIDSVAALVPKAELEGADRRPDRRPAGADDGPGDAQARRRRCGGRGRSASSPTSCAKRSASSTGRRRPSPAAGR